MAETQPTDVERCVATQPGTAGSPAPALTFGRRALKVVGIDRAIGFAVLARGWSAAAGLLTLALIVRHLTPAQTGYYVTFGSLVALQIIFELGFSVVILQLATHEAAHLTLGPDGSVAGEARAHQRLASVLRKAVKWYGVAAAAMGVVLLPVGWHYFSHSPGATEVHWSAPWICTVLASCMTFLIDPVFSFLEGCGLVSKVARTRFTQSVAGSLLGWAALISQHGLYAPALIIFGQAVAGSIFLFTQRRLLLGLVRHPHRQHVVGWRTEVWPFQWRIAVSYASGYLIFQLFNPVLLRFYGPVEAGRMGVSINIANAIASVAIAWISTKAAPFGAMIARREFAHLDAVFLRSVIQTMMLCVGGSILVWSAVLWNGHHQLRFSQRVLPPLPFALLLMTMCLNQGVASLALYLRAHKQEKFLINSVLGGLLVAASTLTLGRWYGPTGMVAGYLAVTLVVGVGMGLYTFTKYRRLWHA